jgi:hypothetical protein
MLIWLGVIPFPDGTGVNVSQNIVHPVNNKEDQFYDKRNTMCFSRNL